MTHSTELPRIQVPKFGGNPMKWVDFIVKFREIVQDQVYLNSNQKFIYLMQHIKGDAKKSSKSIFNNQRRLHIGTEENEIYVWSNISNKSSIY